MSQTAPLPARVQWRAARSRRESYSRSQTENGVDNGFHSANMRGPTAARLNEHPLDRSDTEYDFLFRWSHDLFRNFRTDRGAFVKLEEAVQAPGTDQALDRFKSLLKDKMTFGDDGKLASDELY